MVAASFLLILAKNLLLDISCENIFAFSMVTTLAACPFAIKKKCAKMSVFKWKPRKILGGWGLSPQIPGCAPLPPIAKSWVRHCWWKQGELCSQRVIFEEIDWNGGGGAYNLLIIYKPSCYNLRLLESWSKSFLIYFWLWLRLDLGWQIAIKFYNPSQRLSATWPSGGAQVTDLTWRIQFAAGADRIWHM